MVVGADLVTRDELNVVLDPVNLSLSDLKNRVASISGSFYKEGTQNTLTNFAPTEVDGFTGCLLYTSPSPRD